MKLQKTIFWVSSVICVFSMLLFIAFSTFWKESDHNNIFSSISISVFGSAMLVLVPALITYRRVKRETRQIIISELVKIENLVNDVHFQTTFLKDHQKEYNLDFSFEQNQYELADNISQYIIQKDIYESQVKKVETLYHTVKQIDEYDYSMLDAHTADYVEIFNDGRLIHTLIGKYFDILKLFMIRTFPIPYDYGVRQYEFNNCTTGQFFNIWFKNFLEKLEPIDQKLITLRTIWLILRLRLDRTEYKITVSSSDKDKKHELKKYIKQFYKDSGLSKTWFIKKLLKDLE